MNSNCDKCLEKKDIEEFMFIIGNKIRESSQPTSGSYVEYIQTFNINKDPIIYKICKSCIIKR